MTDADSIMQSLGALRREMEDGLPPQLAIVVAVVRAEAYVDQELDRLIHASGIEASPLGRRLVGTQRKTMHSSWPERLSWLSVASGTQMTARADVQDFLLVNEIRNAVIHGDGYLTSQQVKTAEALINLRKRLWSRLEVPVDGRHIQLTAGQVHKPLTVTTMLVQEVANLKPCNSDGQG